MLLSEEALGEVACMHATALGTGSAVSAGLGLGMGLVMVPYVYQALSPYPRGRPVIVCLNCRGKNPEEFKFCGHCGRSLYPPPRVVCQKCHVRVEDAKFCENCGVKLKE